MQPAHLTRATARSALRFIAIVAALAAATAAPRAQQLSGSALIEALRQGGYVLLMRHTSSPNAKPDKAIAEPDNVTQERQLDQVGRDTARAMGEAIRKLGIPIGDVLSSPTYRALQVVRLASLGQAKTFDELGEGVGNMGPVAESAATWLRNKVSETPRSGTDTLLVTHLPNITGAFGPSTRNVADGEMLVYRPFGKGYSELIGRIKIEEWPALAAGR
jgi:phosphohistidine phosphatase SixA